MKNVTILLAVVAMLAGTAQAALTVYEPFDYYPATELNSSLSGLTESGLTGGWWGYNTGAVQLSTDNASLTYPAACPLAGTEVGARIVEHPTDTKRLSARPLAASVDTGQANEFYMSSLVEKNGEHAADGNIPIGLNVNLGGGAPPYTSYPTPAGLVFGIYGAGFFVQMTIDDKVLVGASTLGETYLLVVKVVTAPSGTADKAYLKIFDSSATAAEMAEPVADGDWDAISEVDDDILLEVLSVRTSYIIGQADEFLMGVTWEDVTGVPEPATMVLLGLGGIGVLLRRRKK